MRIYKRNMSFPTFISSFTAHHQLRPENFRISKLGKLYIYLTIIGSKVPLGKLITTSYDSPTPKMISVTSISSNWPPSLPWIRNQKNDFNLNKKRLSVGQNCESFPWAIIWPPSTRNTTIWYSNPAWISLTRFSNWRWLSCFIDQHSSSENLTESSLRYIFWNQVTFMNTSDGWVEIFSVSTDAVDNKGIHTNTAQLKITIMVLLPAYDDIMLVIIYHINSIWHTWYYSYHMSISYEYIIWVIWYNSYQKLTRTPWS